MRLIFLLFVCLYPGVAAVLNSSNEAEPRLQYSATLPHWLVLDLAVSQIEKPMLHAPEASTWVMLVMGLVVMVLSVARRQTNRRSRRSSRPMR